MPKNHEIVRSDAEYLQHASEIELFDRSNPASVINMVEPQLATFIEDAVKLSPELFDLDDRELGAKLSRKGYPTSPLMNRLRLKFWMYYDQKSTGETISQIRAHHIYNGVCTNRVFWRLMSHPESVAWMLCPPVQYEEHMNEALAYGLDQMRAILEMPNMDKKGNPNTRLLDLKMKITQMIDMRKHGSVLMRSEQKNLHLNLHRTVDTVSEMSIKQSMMKLEEKLKDLKERDNANLTFVEHTILEASREDMAKEPVEVMDDTREGNAGADAAAGSEREGFIEVTPARPSSIFDPIGEEGTG